MAYKKYFRLDQAGVR